MTLIKYTVRFKDGSLHEIKTFVPENEEDRREQLAFVAGGAELVSEEIVEVQGKYIIPCKE